MLDTEVIKSLFLFQQPHLDISLPNPSHGRIALDNAASTQLLLPVLEHIAKSSMEYANVHRGNYDASRVSTERFEQAYNVAANLVNANSWKEIVFGRNTTEMINLVMRSLSDEFRNGDNIVLTRLEHNSNYVPWHALQQMLKRKKVNININIADFDNETGQVDMSQLESIIDCKTKLVAVTGASNFLGTKPNIKIIGQIAHASKYKQPNGRTGSYMFVDAAQLVPGSHVDVQNLNCDFLAWSSHKMAMPLGAGILYGKEDILESMQPFLYGGGMVAKVYEGNVNYSGLPWKFTAGSPNILGDIATGYGIPLMINIGLGNFPSEDATKEDKTNALCEQMKTQVLMNTKRGDFDLDFNIPEEMREIWLPYLDKNPEVLHVLRDPNLRLSAAKDATRTAMINIAQHEQELTEYAIDLFSDIPGLEMYGSKDATQRIGLIAFNIQSISAQTVAYELNGHSIEVRNGLHCAALAHDHLGIESSARVSFYVYNDKKDVEKAAEALHNIIELRGR